LYFIDQKGAYFRSQLSSPISTPPLQTSMRPQQQTQGKPTWIDFSSFYFVYHYSFTFYLFVGSRSTIYILCMTNSWDWKKLKKKKIVCFCCVCVCVCFSLRSFFVFNYCSYFFFLFDYQCSKKKVILPVRLV